MKLALIADCHLGPYPGPTPNSRFDDIVRVLNFAAGKMIEEKVDLCLFAGDAFQSSKVMLDRAQVEISAFYGWVNQLSDAGIHVVIISGTHSHDALAAYELMKKMSGEWSNVRILTTPELVNEFRYGEFIPQGKPLSSDARDFLATKGFPDVTETLDGAFVDGSHKINIACVPGMNRGGIMTREEYRDMTPQEIHRVMSRKVTDIAQGLRAQVDNDCPTVLLSHLTYAEADTGFDHLLLENEAILTPEAVDGFSLVTLGHIHRPQQIPGKNIFYAGSPERLSFSEADITPGFWIFDIEGKDNIKSKFIQTPARRYVTAEFNDDSHSFDSPNVRRLIESPSTSADFCCEDVKDAIVRIHIEATDEQAKLLNRKAIEKAFYDAGAYFVQEIKIEVERTDRSRDSEVTESVTPIDALGKWCAQREIGEEKIATLTRLARELLEEVS